MDAGLSGQPRRPPRLAYRVMIEAVQPEPYPGYYTDEKYSKQFRASEWYEGGRHFIWDGEKAVDVGPDAYLVDSCREVER